jgi:hypothetical protein
MPDMKQIKTAVGKNNALSSLLMYGDLFGQIRP